MMPIYNPYQSQHMMMRAIALEKAKDMAIKDLEVQKLIAMSASERNRFASFPSNVKLQYSEESSETSSPPAQPQPQGSPYVAPPETPTSPPPITIKNEEPKQKPKNSTGKPKKEERTMLFEREGKIGKGTTKANGSVPKPTKAQLKPTPGTGGNAKRVAAKTNKEKAKVNENQSIQHREKEKEKGAEDDTNPDVTLPEDIQNEVMSHLQSMLKNPQSTAKNEQSQFVRDETDLAIKTLQTWHRTHPDAQPTHLAAVVGRLAEKLLLLQSPSPSPSLSRSPPPPPPHPSFPLPHHPALPPPPPKSKKKPALKPPARKKHPAQKRPPPPYPRSSLAPPPYDAYPPPASLPPYDHPPPPPSHFSPDFSDHFPLPSDVPNFPPHDEDFQNRVPRKKRNDLAEWQEAQRHARTQVGRDWTLLRTQQPLSSKLAARLGNNALAQVDSLARAILDDLCTETAMLMTDMENERETGFTQNGKTTSREILQQHQLAHEMKHIFQELSEYEQQEKQLVADAHHELITQAQERSSTENTSTRETINFTSAPPVRISHPPIDAIIAGMKEFEAHVKKKNGGADPIAIGNMVADSILSELVDSTANDIFGVCDSYVDRIVKSEFVV